MWTTEHTIETTLQPEVIWQQWIDVAGWNKTDPGVVESQLDGDLKIGATGRLKPKSGPATRFVITSCEPFSSFIVENGMPLAHMAFEHEMKPTTQGTQFTHRIRITGLLAPLWGRLIGQQIAKDLPGVMERMVAAAATSR